MPFCQGNLTAGRNRGGGFCSGKQSSWMLIVGTSAFNLRSTGLGNAKELSKEELGCFRGAVHLLGNEALASVYVLEVCGGVA